MQKSILCRLVSIVTLVSFTGTNLFLLPAAANENLPAFALPEKGTGNYSLPVPFSASSLKVPAGIGRIEEVYQAKGQENLRAPRLVPPAPFVILIQDAHAIPDAQRNIQKLIEHFQKHYGVNLVALEGASSELDPQIFKSFPDKEILKKTFEEYMEKGELTGSTAAAIFNHTQAIYQGIEDWELYEEGVELYLKAMEEEGELEKKLQAARGELQEEKEKIYSNELLEVDRVLKSFRKNDADLVSVLTKLTQIEKGTGNTPLPVPFSIRTLLEETAKGDKDQSTIDREVREIAERVRLSLQSNNIVAFNQKYQEFQTSRITPEAFALFLKELVESGRGSWEKGTGSGVLPVPFSEELARLIKHHKHLRDIEGTQFFRDFEAYVKSVKESLFRNEEERRLDAESRRLELFEKLARLELSREEWDEIKTTDRVELEGLWSSVFSLLSDHYAFYENAERRDAAFFKNLMRLLKKRGQVEKNPFQPVPFSSDAALLVAGGFHTEGLARQFKESGISYVIVRPEIKSLPEHSRYREHMRGEVSWKDYFEIENGSEAVPGGGKVSLYKAFVRGARDKLLQEAGGAVLTSSNQNDRSQGRGARDRLLREALSVKREAKKNLEPIIDASRDTLHDSRLLKAWRDQILRDLAQKEQLAKAGEYTTFIDEIVRNTTKDASRFTRYSSRPQWLAKVEKFLHGLRRLESKGEINQQKILKLLQPATTADIATYSVLSSSAKSQIMADQLTKKLFFPRRSEMPSAPTELRTSQALERSAPRAEVRSGASLWDIRQAIEFDDVALNLTDEQKDKIRHFFGKETDEIPFLATRPVGIFMTAASYESGFLNRLRGIKKPKWEFIGDKIFLRLENWVDEGGLSQELQLFIREIPRLIKNALYRPTPEQIASHKQSRQSLSSEPILPPEKELSVSEKTKDSADVPLSQKVVELAALADSDSVFDVVDKLNRALTESSPVPVFVNAASEDEISIAYNVLQNDEMTTVTERLSIKDQAGLIRLFDWIFTARPSFEEPLTEQDIELFKEDKEAVYKPFPPHAKDPLRDFLYFFYSHHDNENDFDWLLPALKEAMRDAREGGIQKFILWRENGAGTEVVYPFLTKLGHDYPFLQASQKEAYAQELGLTLQEFESLAQLAVNGATKFQPEFPGFFGDSAQFPAIQALAKFFNLAIRKKIRERTKFIGFNGRTVQFAKHHEMLIELEEVTGEIAKGHLVYQAHYALVEPAVRAGNYEEAMTRMEEFKKHSRTMMNLRAQKTYDQLKKLKKDYPDHAILFIKGGNHKHEHEKLWEEGYRVLAFGQQGSRAYSPANQLFQMSRQIVRDWGEESILISQEIPFLFLKSVITKQVKDLELGTLLTRRLMDGQDLAAGERQTGRLLPSDIKKIVAQIGEEFQQGIPPLQTVIRWMKRNNRWVKQYDDLLEGRWNAFEHLKKEPFVRLDPVVSRSEVRPNADALGQQDNFGTGRSEVRSPDLVVTYHGRIAGEKRIEIFIDVVRLLNKEFEKRGKVLAAEIYGMKKENPSDYELQMQAKVRKFGLESVVQFKGPYEVNELPKLYGSYSPEKRIFLFTGEIEAFGIGVLEALRLGIPVVAPNKGGVSEVLTDPLSFSPEKGILVNVKNLKREQKVQAYTKAILDFFDKRNQSLLTSENLKKWSEEFTHWRMAKNYYELFKSISGKKEKEPFSFRYFSIGYFPFETGGIREYFRNLLQGWEELKKQKSIRPFDIHVTTKEFKKHDIPAEVQTLLNAAASFTRIAEPVLLPKRIVPSGSEVEKEIEPIFKNILQRILGLSLSGDPLLSTRLNINRTNKADVEKLYALWQILQKYDFHHVMDHYLSSFLDELMPSWKAQVTPKEEIEIRDLIKGYFQYLQFPLPDEDILYVDHRNPLGFLALIAQDFSKGVPKALVVGVHSQDERTSFNRILAEDKLSPFTKELQQKFFIFRLNLFYDNAKAVIAVSHSIAHELTDSLAVDGAKIRVIHNGSDFNLPRSEVRNDNSRDMRENYERIDMNLEGVRIGMPSTEPRTNRSLSPVIIASALPATAEASKKSSFGSREIGLSNALGTTNMASRPSQSKSSLISEGIKLNLDRWRTSVNSESWAGEIIRRIFPLLTSSANGVRAGERSKIDTKRFVSRTVFAGLLISLLTHFFHNLSNFLIRDGIILNLARELLRQNIPTLFPGFFFQFGQHSHLLQFAQFLKNNPYPSNTLSVNMFHRYFSPQRSKNIPVLTVNQDQSARSEVGLDPFDPSTAQDSALSEAERAELPRRAEVWREEEIKRSVEGVRRTQLPNDGNVYDGDGAFQPNLGIRQIRLPKQKKLMPGKPSISRYSSNESPLLAFKPQDEKVEDHKKYTSKDKDRQNESFGAEDVTRKEGSNIDRDKITDNLGGIFPLSSTQSKHDTSKDIVNINKNQENINKYIINQLARSEVRAEEETNGEVKRAKEALAKLILKPKDYDWQAKETELRKEKLLDLAGVPLGETDEKGTIQFSPITNFPFRWPILGKSESGWKAWIEGGRVTTLGYELKVKFKKGEEELIRVFYISSLTRKIAGGHDAKGETKEVLDIRPVAYPNAGIVRDLEERIEQTADELESHTQGRALSEAQRILLAIGRGLWDEIAEDYVEQMENLMPYWQHWWMNSYLRWYLEKTGRGDLLKEEELNLADATHDFHAWQLIDKERKMKPGKVVDLSERMLKAGWDRLAREGISEDQRPERIGANMLVLPIRDKAFKRVSHPSIRLIPKALRWKAIEEMNRVLEKGGMGRLSVERGHFTDGFKESLKPMGFEIEEHVKIELTAAQKEQIREAYGQKVGDAIIAKIGHEGELLILRKTEDVRRETEEGSNFEIEKRERKGAKRDLEVSELEAIDLRGIDKSKLPDLYEGNQIEISQSGGSISKQEGLEQLIYAKIGAMDIHEEAKRLLVDRVVPQMKSVQEQIYQALDVTGEEWKRSKEGEIHKVQRWVRETYARETTVEWMKVTVGGEEQVILAEGADISELQRLLTQLWNQFVREQITHKLNHPESALELYPSIPFLSTYRPEQLRRAELRAPENEQKIEFYIQHVNGGAPIRIQGKLDTKTGHLEVDAFEEQDGKFVRVENFKKFVKTVKAGDALTIGRGKGDDRIDIPSRKVSSSPPVRLEFRNKSGRLEADIVRLYLTEGKRRINRIDSVPPKRPEGGKVKGTKEKKAISTEKAPIKEPLILEYNWDAVVPIGILSKNKAKYIFQVALNQAGTPEFKIGDKTYTISKEPKILGRLPEHAIQATFLTDPEDLKRISRNHLTVWEDEKGIHILDKKSSNGTYVLTSDKIDMNVREKGGEVIIRFWPVQNLPETLDYIPPASSENLAQPAEPPDETGRTLPESTKALYDISLPPESGSPKADKPSSKKPPQARAEIRARRWENRFTRSEIRTDEDMQAVYKILETPPFQYLEARWTFGDWENDVIGIPVKFYWLFAKQRIGNGKLYRLEMENGKLKKLHLAEQIRHSELLELIRELKLFSGHKEHLYGIVENVPYVLLKRAQENPAYQNLALYFYRLVHPEGKTESDQFLTQKILQGTYKDTAIVENRLFGIEKPSLQELAFHMSQVFQMEIEIRLLELGLRKLEDIQGPDLESKIQRILEESKKVGSPVNTAEQVVSEYVTLTQKNPLAKEESLFGELQALASDLELLAKPPLKQLQQLLARFWLYGGGEGHFTIPELLSGQGVTNCVGCSLLGSLLPKLPNFGFQVYWATTLNPQSLTDPDHINIPHAFLLIETTRNEKKEYFVFDPSTTLPTTALPNVPADLQNRLRNLELGEVMTQTLWIGEYRINNVKVNQKELKIYITNFISGAYASFLYNFAKDYVDHSLFQETEDTYQKSIAASPGQPEAWVNLAALYARFDQWEKVRDASQRAIGIDSRLTPAYHNLGAAYVQLGNLENNPELLLKGTQAYETAFQLGSKETLSFLRDRGAAHSLLALFDKPHADKALEFYKRALRLDPHDAETWHRLAFLYEGYEKEGISYKKASEWIRGQILRMPSLPIRFYRYADFLGRMRRSLAGILFRQSSFPSSDEELERTFTMFETLVRAEVRLESQHPSRRDFLKLVGGGSLSILFQSNRILLAEEKETGKIMLFFLRHVEEEDFKHVKPHLKKTLDRLLREGKIIHFFLEGPETDVEFVAAYTLYQTLNPKNKDSLADIFGKDLYQGSLPVVFFDWVFAGRPVAGIYPGMRSIKSIVTSAKRPKEFDPKRWAQDYDSAIKILDQMDRVYRLYLQILNSKMPPGSKVPLKEARQRIEQVFEQYINELDQVYNNNQPHPFVHRFLWKLHPKPSFFEAQTQFLWSTYGKQLGKQMFIHHERSLLPEDLTEHFAIDRLYAFELPEGLPMNPNMFAEEDRNLNELNFSRIRHLPAVFFKGEAQEVITQIPRPRKFSGSLQRQDPWDEKIDEVLDYWAELYRKSYHLWAQKRDEQMSRLIAAALKKPEDVAFVTRGADHKEGLGELMIKQAGRDETLVKDLDWKRKEDEEKEDLSLILKEEKELYVSLKPPQPLLLKGEKAIALGLLRYLVKTLELYWLQGEENVKSPFPKYLEDFSARLTKRPELAREFFKETLRIHEIYQKLFETEFGKDKRYRDIEYGGELYAVYRSLIKGGILPDPKSKWVEERFRRYEKQLLTTHPKDNEKINLFLKKFMSSSRSEVRLAEHFGVGKVEDIRNASDAGGNRDRGQPPQIPEKGMLWQRQSFVISSFSHRINNYSENQESKSTARKSDSQIKGQFLKEVTRESYRNNRFPEISNVFRDEFLTGLVKSNHTIKPPALPRNFRAEIMPDNYNKVNINIKINKNFIQVTARRVVRAFEKGSDNDSVENWAELAGSIERMVLAGEVKEFVQVMRREVRRKINSSQENIQAAVEVSPEAAEKAIQFWLDLLAKSRKGNIALGFDEKVDSDFIEALHYLKGNINPNDRFFFTRDMAKHLAVKDLSGLTVQFLGDMNRITPSQLATVDHKALPVVRQKGARSETRSFDANPVTYFITNQGSIEGEPFLKVAAHVAEAVTAIYSARLIEHPQELHNPKRRAEIRAELVRKLFDHYSLNMIQVTSKGLIVNRSELRQFIVDHFARTEIQRSA